MRETSVAVYRQIKAEGLLSRRRMEVYTCIFEHGPLTCGETVDKLQRISGVLQHSITPRFAELNDMGVITIVGERMCSVTGRECLLWDVTNRLPKPLPKQDRRRVWVSPWVFDNDAGVEDAVRNVKAPGYIECVETKKKNGLH